MVALVARDCTNGSVSQNALANGLANGCADGF